MRVPLTGGSYTAKSIIANAQRCLNLYPEANPEGSPVPFTYYPRPGLTQIAAPGTAGYGRGLYRATNGALYGVVWDTVYRITYSSGTWAYTSIGTIATGFSRVSMADNGISIMLVDGTTSGYVVTMATDAFASITDPAFYGADTVQYVDTYFVLNKPATPAIYISLSNSTDFDSLDFASKTGSPDNIVGVQIMHREAWLIGTESSEVWYNTGAADFTFGPVPGVYIEHGCCAKYSLAKQDLSVYWLSQDRQGHLLVLEGNGYKAARISTHALENAIQAYDVFDDAWGFTYQVEGHTFYQLTFPTADRTWTYDVSTGFWHEQSWTDTNGVQHRHRACDAAFAYGTNVMMDWETGALYEVGQDVYLDAGDTVIYLRSFPHIEKDGRRLFHRQFILDMEVGAATGILAPNPPLVSLRWSNDRGASWGNAVTQSLGATGEYLTSVQFQRLGYARDRVYEASWSVPYKTALNGAWLDLTVAGT